MTLRTAEGSLNSVPETIIIDKCFPVSNILETSLCSYISLFMYCYLQFLFTSIYTEMFNK